MLKPSLIFNSHVLMHYPIKKYTAHAIWSITDLYESLKLLSRFIQNCLNMRYLLLASRSLTHWGRDKMAAISQTTFSNAFSWMKIYQFRLRFHWKFFPREEIYIPALVQIMAWRRRGDKPLSEPVMVSLLTHICATRPQWVNSCSWNHSLCKTKTYLYYTINIVVVNYLVA